MLERELHRMKIFRTAIVCIALAAALPAQESKPEPHRPRVALALSGGGSLGIAHIGVLQYFEEHHIPVDAIAGSSIGGLVGGLYATGHTPQEIEAAFTQADWAQITRIQTRYQDLPFESRQLRAEHPGEYALQLGRGLSLPAGLSTVEPLDLLLSRQLLNYSTVEDFSQLPTPFRCVATQLETGEAFVLSHGNLARALRATMAVPGVFTPVEWEGHVLVDGGLVDNLPTDVARAMGADVVVAVHFSVPLPPAKQLQSLNNVLTQAVSVSVAVTERENLRTADLVLAPSLTGIGGIDYQHARELIERGYQAAAQKERFLATLALNDADWAAYQAERRSRMRAPAPLAERWRAHSSDPALEKLAQAELDRVGGQRSLDRFEQELSQLAAGSALPAAFYRLSNDAAKPELVAELDPRRQEQLSFRPSVELAVANHEPTRGALHGFVAWLPQNEYGTIYRMQFSAGYSPQLAASYQRSIGTSRWFWMPSLNLARLNSSTYNGSEHFTHWQDSYSAAFDIGYEPGRHAQLRAGLEAGYERLSPVSYSGALAVDNGAFLQPHLIVEWNSLDDGSLPQHGALLSASMAGRYRQWDGSTVPLGRARFEQHWNALAGNLTASLSAATSFGEKLNYFDLFPLGGESDLRAYRYEQFHASSYAMGELGYRKPIRELKLFGRSPQLGAWYDAAGLTQPRQNWQSEQSGSLGVLFDSPLGVLTFAIGRTSDGQTRGWIRVGKP
jgi:NTE family protein